MSHTPRRSMLISRTVAGAVMLFLAVPIAGPADGAENAASPQLSIAIDNGQTSAKNGDTLTYRTVVTNLGPDRVAKLHITQSLPPGLTAKSADANGVITRAEVSWVVNLKAAGKTTLTTSATLSKTSRQTLRLASVACASVGSDGPPIVCASHSDQLAAGARADAAASAASDGGTAWWDHLWIFVCSGIALVVAALVVLRQRLGRPAHISEG